MNTSGDDSTTLACAMTGEVIRTFGEVRIRVFGTSMVPSILPGDVISVRRTSLSEISLGDIVLYLREGRLFAHRVTALVGSHDDPRLITRGDRLSHNDPAVSCSELLGRVTSIQCAYGRGHRQIGPAAGPNAAGQIIVRLLQISNRATYLYLKLDRYWGRCLSGATACWP